MNEQAKTVMLDGEAVARMASAGIVDLWNENGVLMGRDDTGKVFAFPAPKRKREF